MMAMLMMLLCCSIRWEHMIVEYLSMPTYDSALQHAKSIFYPAPFLILKPGMMIFITRINQQVVPL